MRKVFGLAVIVLLLSLAVVVAEPVVDKPDGWKAVVQIGSHGGSGTVIQSTAKETLILTAWHLFGSGSAPRECEVSVPWDDGTTRKFKATRRLYDDTTDLALLVCTEKGPWPYVCPIAAANHKCPKQMVSCGYDAMRTPAVAEKSTLLGQVENFVLSKELMIPGRSGGPLIDPQANVVVGVVSRGSTYGVMGDGFTWPKTQGIYAGPDAIADFVKYYEEKVRK